MANEAFGREQSASRRVETRHRRLQRGTSCYSTNRRETVKLTPSHFFPTAPSGLVWGINRGHKTERRVLPKKPSNRKGAQTQRSQVVKSVVREVAGFAPYERRAMELLRNSKVSWRSHFGSSRDKVAARGSKAREEGEIVSRPRGMAHS